MTNNSRLIVLHGGCSTESRVCTLFNRELDSATGRRGTERLSTGLKMGRVKGFS